MEGFVDTHVLGELLPARRGVWIVEPAAQELADELLRRWLDDPDAAPKWLRLAEDVRVDEPLD